MLFNNLVMASCYTLSAIGVICLVTQLLNCQPIMVLEVLEGLFVRGWTTAKPRRNLYF